MNDSTPLVLQLVREFPVLILGAAACIWGMTLVLKALVEWLIPDFVPASQRTEPSTALYALATVLFFWSLLFSMLLERQGT